MFQTLKYIPARIAAVDGEILGILAFGLLGAVLVLVPFIARGRRRAGGLDWLAVSGTAALIYILALTALGYWT